MNDQVTLQIQNLAPFVSEAEASLVEQGGYRTEYAKIMSADGSGIGLTHSYEISEAWGLSLKYEVPRKPISGGKLGLHKVTLKMSIFEEDW